ncbi:amidohydrolase family protein [Roseomonas sp. NAR14]|uniref:Amidohydrolase family protein n=1 Tax=Roseomonas acroporae TaxID=2937791 RepID=A0A9X1Y3G1_9PROT|nr:amidohydrolase family protein [Roseomonas acroporae]MCK8783469.1 amidohydrolase family protein [Roseomonas acroporae]
MTRPCLPPRDLPSTPGWRAPPGSTDCHFHINGPYDRYPLDAGRSYTPPEALVPQYRRMAEILGLDRHVVVQPSVFGTDNRCTLDSLDLLGRADSRAIVVIDEGIDDAALRDMAGRGAVGVRFNAVSGNGTPLAQLDALARRLAPLGWHIQIYARGEQLIGLAPALQRLPVPVVLDHMGGVQSSRGVASPEFRALLGLLESGRAWVKLSGYRSSSQGHPYTDVAPMARALLAAAPERCVWGTDWPHPNLYGDTPMPDDGELLDRLGEWAPTEALRRQVLVENPARLYGFA